MTHLLNRVMVVIVVIMVIVPKKIQLGPKHIIIRVIGNVRPPGATWYTGY